MLNFSLARESSKTAPKLRLPKKVYCGPTSTQGSKKRVWSRVSGIGVCDATSVVSQKPAELPRQGGLSSWIGSVDSLFEEPSSTAALRLESSEPGTKRIAQDNKFFYS